MGCTLRLILGDQLTATLPVITDAVKTRDILLMAEVKEEATYARSLELAVEVPQAYGPITFDM